MINIGICDEDAFGIEKIVNVLNLMKNKMSDMWNLYIFHKAEELIDQYKKIIFDIILIEIELGTVSGLEVVRKIKRNNPLCLFICMSGTIEYIEEVVELEIFRFIRKPFRIENFCAIISEAINKLYQLADCFEYIYKNELFKLPFRNIIYFESELRKIKVHMMDADHIESNCFYGKLNNIENMIAEKPMCFLRIHQSFLVNYNYIKRIQYPQVELYNGKILLISKERQKGIRELCRKMPKGE